jgi:hypothetical protein
LSQNARRISGQESLRTLPLKKASRTAGQPDEVTTAVTTIATTTAVLPSARATPCGP